MKLAVLTLALAVAGASAGTNEAGKAFLEENAKKDGVVVLESGLQYKILESGKEGAPSPKVDTPCECHYKGTLIDGTEFDSSYSRGSPTTFAPNQVIKGWTEAMQLMKEGDKWELYIPSELGYGDSGSGSKIKGGDVLIFTLDMIKVKGSGNESSSSSSSEKKKTKSKPKKEEAPTKVVSLTDEDFAETVYGSDRLWVVEFYAPWCGHCKNLAPEWKKAAAELDGFERKGVGVSLADIDATANHVAKTEFEISGFPTIKFFRPGSKGPHDAEDYTGPREAKGIVKYVKDLAKPVVPKLTSAQLTEASQFAQCLGERTRHEDEPAADDHGLSSGDWCVVAILPHILDTGADRRRELIAMVDGLYEDHRGGRLQVLWTEAGAQPALEAAVRATTRVDLVFPAVAAFNTEREEMAVHVGQFSRKKLHEIFLPGLRNGWARVSKSSELAEKGWAEVVETAPWDGKDGELPEEEEEFSLEDIMGEEL
jgi:FKBP-type peptidyl-prolyl cis-trans isomerase FklB